MSEDRDLLQKLAAEFARVPGDIHQITIEELREMNETLIKLKAEKPHLFPLTEASD